MKATKGATTDISQLLESERPDLIVTESVERELRMTDQEASHHFERVVVRSFGDLQALGFAPAEVTEAHVRAALADDDLEALRTSSRPCNCTDATDEQSNASASRVAFDEIRATQHPHLARLFSEQTGIEHQWDSISVRVLAGAMSQLSLHELYLQLLLARDIVVQANASLLIDAGISLLRARDIKLHVGARLVLTGPYAKVICRSVKGDLV